MRLWSLDPSLLDKQGLGGAWREGLLAQKCLVELDRGNKIGYCNHPQLDRFKEQFSPVEYLSQYLWKIYIEATERGYTYNSSKIIYDPTDLPKIPVKEGQVYYEYSWLRAKLDLRSSTKIKPIKLHPLFEMIGGGLEKWEKPNARYR